MEPARRPAGRWIEAALALAVLAGVVRSMWYLLENGYLPQPFFYEPQDIWMDWFNTAHWAHVEGAYDSWGTIYPPLSFVVLRLLTAGQCYLGAEGYAARDCDIYGMVTLHLLYLVNVALTIRTFMRIDRRTALPRSIAVAAGLPMLYALERGNLILLTYTFVQLAYGPLVRHAWARWVFAGLAINLKVYLIGTLFAQLLRRRWRWFEGALAATIILYLITYAVFGAGTPRQIYDNIASFSGLYQAVSLLDLWYTTTYLPLISLLEGSTFPVIGVVGSARVEAGLVLLPMAVRATQLAILLAAAAAWLRPEVVPMHRLIFLSIALALITAEAGGYTQILLVVFVLMERWRGTARPVAILCAYLLSIPADIPVDYVPPILRESFIAGRPVLTMFEVGLGSFLRPGIVLLMAMALSGATLAAVWRDIRAQGWRGRWRFRHDAPILAGEEAAGRPLAPRSG